VSTSLLHLDSPHTRWARASRSFCVGVATAAVVRRPRPPRRREAKEEARQEKLYTLYLAVERAAKFTLLRRPFLRRK